jgi:hypothetical protein
MDHFHRPRPRRFTAISNAAKRSSPAWKVTLQTSHDGGVLSQPTAVDNGWRKSMALLIVPAATVFAVLLTATALTISAVCAGSRCLMIARIAGLGPVRKVFAVAALSICSILPRTRAAVSFFVSQIGASTLTMSSVLMSFIALAPNTGKT